MTDIRINRRQFGLTLGAAAGTAGFAAGLASGLAPGFASRAFAAGSPDLSGVTLRVGDQTGNTRATLEAAGLLDDVPYQIEWSVFPAAVHLHEALKADAADIGASADAPALSAIAGGSKIRFAGAWSNGGLGTAIIVPKDSPIQTLADLRGKTISPTTRGSIGHFITLTALKQAGLTPDDVKLAFLNPTDASAAFQSGDIDAWATWSVYIARSVGQLGARVLISGEKGLTSGLFIYNITDKALQDPGKVAATREFLDRWDRAYAWTRENKEDWLTFYQAWAKQERPIAEALYPSYAGYERQALDERLTATVQNTYDVWKQAGVLTADIDIPALITKAAS